MFRDSIEKFPRQFLWDPVIENAENFWHRENIIVAGMGGSHLSADLLKAWKPELKLFVWSDYGLPPIPDAERDSTLIIASSYSGNTEETLNAYMTAQRMRLPLIAISVGGRLLDYAKRDGVPFIRMPDTKIQPRMSLGFGAKALLKIVGEERALGDITLLSESLLHGTVDYAGKKLAEKLKNKIPVIYASARNRAVARVWKIKLNESAKTPAFYNVFPELNHNEMTGFDMVPQTAQLSAKLHFVFLKDAGDNPAILRRMEITEEVLRKKQLPVESVWMQEGSRFHTIFSSIFYCDWVTLYLAEMYHVDPEEVLLIEEFKRKMSR